MSKSQRTRDGNVNWSKCPKQYLPSIEGMGAKLGKVMKAIDFQLTFDQLT